MRPSARSDASAGKSGGSLLRAPRGAVPILLGALLLALAAWSWRKWPDALIDFGMQLYIPWRLSEGEHLQADIAWKLGPLSQYFHAGLFRLFGVSLTTLIWANLALIACLTALIVRFFTAVRDRMTGFACGAAFLCVFAFGQYAWMGNWNYMAPYAHEATHGLLLGIALVACLASSLRGGGLPPLVASGVLLGLALLTKAELGLASGAAAAAGPLAARLAGPPAPRPARVAVVLLGGAAGTVGLAAAGLSLLASPGVAARAVVVNWGLIFSGSAGAVPLYRLHSGLDDPAGNLWLMGRACGLLLLLVACAALADGAFAALRQGRAALLGAAFVLPILICRFVAVPWEGALRPLPVIALIAAAVALRGLGRSGAQPERAAQAAGMLLWSVFALAAMLKILLKTRVPFFGFVHAMPGAMLLVALLLSPPPGLGRLRGPRGDVSRALLGGLLAAGLLGHLEWSNRFYSRKTFTCGSGGDAIVSYPPEVDAKAYALSLLEGEIARRAPPGGTLLVVPEGILVNYRLRRVNPVPYLAFTPYDIATFGGEEAVVRRLSSRPPGLIALVHREMPEFGAGRFGSAPGRGRLIMDWIGAGYTPVWRLGAEPNTSDRFGLAILERRTAPGGAPAGGAPAGRDPQRFPLFP